MLPRGSRHDTPEYHYADGVALQLYDPAAVAEQSVRIPGDADHADSVFAISRAGDQITVARTEGPQAPWSVVLPIGIDPDDVTGGDAAVDDDSRPTITATTDSVVVPAPGVTA